MKHLPPVYRHMKRLLDAETGTALATVIARTGSGPREPGAVMLVTPEGIAAGTVGGGSLEAAVIRKAQTAIENGRAVCETYTLTHDAAADDGMICGGVMEVLIQPLFPLNPFDAVVLKRFLNRLEPGRTVWLVTAVSGGPGARQTAMGYVATDEMNPGSLPLSGKEIAVLMDRNPRQVPFLSEVGGARVFFQPVSLPEPVYIFGAGHIAEVLTPVCRHVGFFPVVLDDRVAFANTDRFPEAGQVLVLESFKGCFKQLQIHEKSFLVIVTRGHAHDRTVAEQALKTPAQYIGMIGSRRKRDAVYRLLSEAGFTTEDLRRIHCPVGLSIGAESPAEIAVSIVAELIAVRKGHILNPLR